MSLLYAGRPGGGMSASAALAAASDAVLRTEAESRSLAIDVPLVAHLAALPTGISNGTVVDVTSPAVRVERTAGAWVMTGGLGGGVYAPADLAAWEALIATMAAASVAVADMLTVRAVDTGIQWCTLASVGGRGALVVPAHPLGELAGVVTAYTSLDGFAGGSDPLATWVDLSTGVDDTDYSITEAGGTTTLSDLTLGGRAMIADSAANPSSVDEVVMLYMQGVNAATAAGSGSPVQIVVNAYEDGDTIRRAAITLSIATSATHWVREHAATGSPGTAVDTLTGQAINADHDIRIAVHQDRCAYWFGDGAIRPYIYDENGDGQGHHVDGPRQLAIPGYIARVLVGGTGVAGVTTLDIDRCELVRLTLTGGI